MPRSGNISVVLPRAQLTALKELVENGEFAAPDDVIREAVATWLHRRKLRAKGGERFGRATLRDATEPFERVELLFDAGDAKA